MADFGKKEIEAFAEEFESQTAQEILAWSANKFGNKIAQASSFGPEDMVLISMLCEIQPGFKVITLDTDFLFKETYELIEKVREKYEISLEINRPQITIEEMEKQYGTGLFQRDPALCCKIRKIDPLKKALLPLEAWITGIRRDQTPARANSRKIEYDDIFNLVKINPLADWASDQVWNYIRENKVPYNSLHDKNYSSIGCEPCTQPVKPGEDPRRGRWTGKEKTECGLHLK